MEQFISLVSGFISSIVTATLVGSAVLLIAGEIRLASLRKARQGSVKLTSFTERMTGTKLRPK